jgi:uncharacterized protein (DUF1684 family)
MTPAEHREAVLAWRTARDARLRDPDGWLTLIGLHWLTPGENRIGSDPDNDLVVRSSHVPSHAGSLVLVGGSVVLRRDEMEDEPLETDLSGEPTILRFGPIHAHVIERSGRFALRVRDREHVALASFAGMEHFPIDPGWRLVARFEAAPAGTRLEIMDVTGTMVAEEIPGAVTFDRDGSEWRIQALPGGGDGSLWLIFADGTSGRTTYGGGRFLYTEPVGADGSVVVDFNLAYNPPCVFSSFATCPLPPSVNRLALPIEAGERGYVEHA